MFHFENVRCLKIWNGAKRLTRQPPTGERISLIILTSKKRKQTTSRGAQPKPRFRVTHPFHPWFGREFEYEDDQERFGHRRLFYRLDNGQIAYFLTRWTDQAPKDPFVEMAVGKALARPKDLLDLIEILAGLNAQA